MYAEFGEDEKTLTADRAANSRGELRFLAYVHFQTCFPIA